MRSHDFGDQETVVSIKQRTVLLKENVNVIYQFRLNIFRLHIHVPLTVNVIQFPSLSSKNKILSRPDKEAPLESFEEFYQLKFYSYARNGLNRKTIPSLQNVDWLPTPQEPSSRNFDATGDQLVTVPE